MNPTLEQSSRFGYEADDCWARLPAGWSWPEVAAVATDSKDRVFVFNRGDHPVIIFDRDGSFRGSWGEGLFVRAHGLHIAPDDSVWCTDDSGHTVRKFTPEGTLLLTLGECGKPSDTGATSVDFRTILRAGPPFHYPTNVAIAPCGDVYVSDGYGNARIHRFSADGKRSRPIPHPARDSVRQGRNRLRRGPRKQPDPTFLRRRPIHVGVDRRRPTLANLHGQSGPILRGRIGVPRGDVAWHERSRPCSRRPCKYIRFGRSVVGAVGWRNQPHRSRRLLRSS
jgi:hypothetical protein